jgi:pimeloyl-ACP methyl ester carboxylesterase/1-acyl-sn-glycerol-3-phosphate acyltransferase
MWRKQSKPEGGLWGLAKSAGMVIAGFAATAFPLWALLHKELRATPEVRSEGWPIQVMQVLFARYVVKWIDVQGLENLPSGSYIVAANHAYKSGVDGFILGHLIATHARRVPHIVITADSRNWLVRAERWILHFYGIALLTGGKRRAGVSDAMAAFLRKSDRQAILIFPAGRAIADPTRQLKDWSTGAVVAAWKARVPVVPVAIGGLRLDWTPETVVFSAMDATEQEPFQIHVRIGKAITPTGESQIDLEELRGAVAKLMEEIPGLRPAAGESAAGFGKITLQDGRSLAFMDRGPRSGTPVLYFHGLQGSRLEQVPGLDDLLIKLHIRMIIADRPGLGLSTPSRDRTVRGWAEDVRQLSAALPGPGQPFSILGFSAGATYALACGALPGLRAISLVSGLGLPHLIANWRRFSEETWQILLSAKLASVRIGTFLKIEKKHRDQLFNHWDTYFAGVKKGLSEDDRRILSKPEVEELFRQNRREGFAQGPGYLLQEVQALYSDPQIDLTHLSACAVLITHGTDDTAVPIGVARDLQTRIPGSRLNEMPGRGHYFIYEEMEYLLQDLLRAHRIGAQLNPTLL